MASTTSVTTREELHSLPGVQPRPAGTSGYHFQQTMLRIRQPERSLDFYTGVLGMTLVDKLDFPKMSFSLYFLAYQAPDSVADNPKDRIEQCFSRDAVLELTHNWDAEESGFEAHSGNQEPKGFGHIGIEVPDVYAACDRFKELGVNFVKEPDGGSMKGIAFITDPDGYWIEVLNAKSARSLHD